MFFLGVNLYSTISGLIFEVILTLKWLQEVPRGGDYNVNVFCNSHL